MWKGGCGHAGAEVPNGREEERAPERELGRLH